MSFGSQSTYSTSTPTLTPQQTEMIQAQTDFFKNSIQPSYQNAVAGENALYNQTAPGVNTAAQNLSGISGQAQNVLGSTGESALRTGINGLESLYSPDYEAQQLNAAMMPAQAQYAQNIANQQAQFGGAGQLGSARSDLAQQQTAGQTQAAQMMAGANVESQIAAQRAAAGQALIGAGQGGMTAAQSAANNQLTASMAPQALYNQYANVLFGTPSQSWNPNFAGTQTIASTGGGTSFGLNLKP